MQTQFLTLDEARDLRCLAGMMIPPSAELGMPGADDPAITADMQASIGRDLEDVRTALAELVALAGGPFADLPPARQDILAARWRAVERPALATLRRVILQCYYRDDRVVRALGREARPPFPKGNVLEQGDWSLLEPVRARPKMWRDVAGG